jgi:pre-mRNA-splicing helicase BRR2
MEHGIGSGGAEGAQRLKQYEYRANSNLVLTAENRSARTNEATGEPETLWGRMRQKDMGTRVTRERPQDLEDKLERLKKKKEAKAKRGALERKDRGGPADVLKATDQFSDTYRPKTKETKSAYEQLLVRIRACLGDLPPDIMRGAADEVLAVLKNDRMKDSERKTEIEKLVNKLHDETFAEVVRIGQRITDYSATEAEAAEDKMDDEIGVAVVFDEDEEEEDSDLDEIRDASDDDDEGATQETSREVKLAARTGDHESDEEDEDVLRAHEIDAYWLQRKIGEYFEDPLEAQQKSDETLATMQELDGRECENKLVMLLDAYDKFDFIKVLMKNRNKIVYCTLLARAQNDEEKAAVESKMAADPELQSVLAELNKQSTRLEKDRALEERVRREARNIAKAGAADGGVEDMDDGATVAGSQGAHQAPKSMLDLANLSFAEGSHLMSNKKCELPKGSFRAQKKGYDEVHIPAVEAAHVEGERLVPLKELPDWAQLAFAGMTKLNRVQSKMYEAAFKSPENILLCAPTGAGKTNVAMMTMLHEIGQHRDPESGEIDLAAFKIVYIAPMKALVQECVGNFGKRLQGLGITVRELSGDQSLTKQQIMETQIIVTTPEKWDIVTRKSGDRTYTQLVKLVIIDEVHLLHDERGPVLESIVSRTIRQVESTQQMIRLVGLSATLPNYEDVATFMRVKPDKGLFYFDGTYRPCPLKQQYIGITERKAIKRFQLMNEITYEKVMEEAGENQIIVFVHARKETARTARALRDMALENDDITRLLKDGSGSREVLQTECEVVKDQDLKEILPYSFGIHHAGMNKTDRALVEDLFADGHIQVLVSTATLAWGVNLPAHTVVIKGTQIYSPEAGKWVELSPMDVMQMLGRAGRPQFDSFGHGIVITMNTQLQYYLSLMNQQLPVESQLVKKLPDALNADVVMGAVQNMKEAIDWLGYSFLYVRMLRNPTLYGIAAEELESDPLLEQRRADLVHTAATVLDRANLVKYDKKSGKLQTTDLGRVSSHYYITYSSMATYNEHLKPTTSDIELFRLFSLSEEFKYINVREEEKLELEKLLNRVPVPVKESIEEPTAKVNVLLQSYISQLKLDGFALMSDMVFITQSAGRLIRAIFEIVLKRGWAGLAMKCLELCKMVDRRMWPSQSPLRQFKGIPEGILKKIEKIEFPWERFYDLTAQEIGELIRFPKMGKNIYKRVHQFPRLDLAAHVLPITRTVLRVELTITPDFQFEETVHGFAEGFWIIVEDVDSEYVLHHQFFVLKNKFAEDEHVLNFTIPIYEPLPPQYFIRVVSDRWLGAEMLLPISFRHLILPEKYPPHTELLDLQPLPVSALKDPKYEALYKAMSLKHFNPIQTQVFNQMYNTDDNVLIGAPTGSGKTIAAEFAVLHMFNSAPDGKCVYIAPLESLTKERFEDWSSRFGSQLGKTVVHLTGETAPDMKALKTGNVIISTPERWDVLSRRWKQRKDVQNINLFIVDEMHLIGGEHGPCLEVVTSRMRYISAQTHKPIRIVALTTSLANARDLGEWIGCTSHGLFNFHPNVRPVPLEIHIQGFDMQSFSSRMLAMSRPSYLAVCAHSPEDPVLVFVPSKKQCRMVAFDFLTYAAADNTPDKFLQADAATIAPFIERCHNSALQHTLSKGVGFLHEGLSNAEKEVVRQLYSSGAIQVLIVARGMCWGMSESSKLTIIMGTDHYNGREHRYSEYSVADMLQMMGRASRPLEDDSGKCVIFCHTPQKEFYKKFLFEPLPVESHLDHYLHDHLNAEVMTKTVETKQDAVDYLTWTFFYRRLAQNPNYYNLQGISHRHLSDHLSETIEQVLSDLEQSKCISIEDDMDLSSLNLGMISAYYYTKYTSIELFSSSITAKTSMKKLVEILCAASEFDSMPVRQNEDEILQRIANHLPLRINNAKFTDPHTKVNVLLQAHFSRTPLTGDLRDDQKLVLETAARLLQAVIDVISSNGWLAPAVAAMEMAQMVTQALWDRDSQLLQLPHFTKRLAAVAEKQEVEGVFDLMEMEDEDRSQLLEKDGGLSAAQLSDIAKVCNTYPNIEVQYDVEDADEITVGSTIALAVQLEREGDPTKVHAPFYPTPKDEGWWLLVGNAKTNELCSIKRVSVAQRGKARLEFDAPETAGEYEYTLYFMSDSYLGCDQEYELTVKVDEEEDDDSDDDDEDSEEEQEKQPEGSKRKRTDGESDSDSDDTQAKRAK